MLVVFVVQLLAVILGRGGKILNFFEEVESSCGGECPGRPEQVEQCTPDCGIYGVWNGQGTQK